MRYRISHVLPWLLVFVAGIVFGPMVIHSAVTLLAPTPAVASSPAQNSPDDTTARASHQCKIDMVATYPAFVGVKCANGVGSAVWFISPSSNAQQAARILSTALTAHAADKQVFVYYDTVTTGLPADCNPEVCRFVQALHMLD